jgi:hypothetical protein
MIHRGGGVEILPLFLPNSLFPPSQGKYANILSGYDLLVCPFVVQKRLEDPGTVRDKKIQQACVQSRFLEQAENFLLDKQVVWQPDSPSPCPYAPTGTAGRWLLVFTFAACSSEPSS